MRLTSARPIKYRIGTEIGVRQGRRSTAVVQRFCKPKVGSSILSAGTIPLMGGKLQHSKTTFLARASAPRGFL